MEDQVLTIKQMLELKNLGINIYKASMLWYPKMAIDIYTGKGYVESHYLNLNHIDNEHFWSTRIGKETIPTFTLQNILEICPKVIMTEEDNFELHLNTYQCYIQYQDSKHAKMLNIEFGNSILEAAFNMLKWCKQYNFI